MKNIFIIVILLLVVGGTTFQILKPNHKQIVDHTPTPTKSFSCETIIKIITPEKKASTLTPSEERADNISNMIISLLNSSESSARAIDHNQLGKLFECDPNKLKEKMARDTTIQLNTNSNLITVTTYGSSKIQAQQLNYALLKSVADLYHHQLENNYKQAISIIKNKILEQEAKVEVHRKKLYSLSKQLGIPQQSDQKISAYEQTKRKRDQLESYINALKSLKGEDLIVTILASGISEVFELKSDYEEESKLKQQKAASLATGPKLSNRLTKELNEKMNSLQKNTQKSAKHIQERLKKDLADLNKKLTNLKISHSKKEMKQITSTKVKNQFTLLRE